VEGLAQFRQQLGRLGGALWAATYDWLRVEGEAIMADSKANYCPKDTGTLAGTGHVVGPVNGTSGMVVLLIYGGPAAPYALHVHEGTRPHIIRARFAKVLAVPFSRYVMRKGYKHGRLGNYQAKTLPKLTRDGRWVILGKVVHHPGTKGTKYLEIPVKNAAPGFEGRLGAALAKAIRSVVRK
jgi:hypothetical protein